VIGESNHSAAVSYSSYLALDELLSAQHPRSDEHDELLFIVIHQVYELWFKQLLHELRRLQARLDDGDGPRALHTLRRILAIFKTVVAQVDVLETMTPRQFASFRARLATASGFQSAQFRELEALLGRREERALRPYAEDSPERARIAAAMAAPAVIDSLLRYLTARGFAVPARLLQRDVTEAWPPDAELQDALVAVYAADGEEAQVLERLVDLDEGLQEWRYRHVKMVERTIGDQPGTGGSPGAAYLRSTLFAPAFPDLWAIRPRL
jgi:tryptophan 2,3-dioxygenase